MRKQAERPGLKDPTRHRLFWVALAAPGIIWLALLFIVPFYVVLAIAAGQLNQVFGTPIPVWNPLQWSTANLAAVWHTIVGKGAFVGPDIVRTIVYTAIASLL